MKTINEILRNSRILLYQENNIWVAQCLEYDFATQGAKMQDAINALENMILGQVALDTEDGIEPLSEIPPAPISVLMQYMSKISEQEKIQLSEAWEIIDDFSLIVFLQGLQDDSRFFTIFKRAITWLRKYES